MLHQQLTIQELDMSGTLTIRAEAGYAAELITLATELAETHENVETDGTLVILPPEPPPA